MTNTYDLKKVYYILANLVPVEKNCDGGKLWNTSALHYTCVMNLFVTWNHHIEGQ